MSKECKHKNRKKVEGKLYDLVCLDCGLEFLETRFVWEKDKLTKPTQKHEKSMQESAKVCIKCGHEVSECGPRCFHGEYFCGNCGEFGSHTKAVDKEKWEIAQEILNS